ncbi:MAG: thiamine ABC transporter substrate binding subunit [Gammaproteobacteria bacterium]|nr:MAG: thiamine ABC transporter substrate binding subunit [Gammaproteobacteria bacterium]
MKNRYFPVFSLLVSALCSSLAWSAGLTIYTYDSFVSEWGPGPKLEKLFEQQCQCDIKFIAAEDGVSILNRLRIEGDATKADVLLGIDDALMATAQRENLVKPHSLKLPSLVKALDWQDNLFVPFDYGYFAFVYDSTKINQPATSLKGLIESDASVIYQDPRTSTPGQGFMIWVNQVYGNGAEAAWQKLAKHTVTVTKGWWEAYSLFLQGDADYVLSYSTSPAYHVVAENKHQYKAAEFTEGHIMQVEVAALTRTAKNTELAQSFLAFLLTPEAQKIIATGNWMLPVIDGIELPAIFSQLIKPVKLDYDAPGFSENRAQWAKQWRAAASK